MACVGTKTHFDRVGKVRQNVFNWSTKGSTGLDKVQLCEHDSTAGVVVVAIPIPSLSRSVGMPGRVRLPAVALDTERVVPMGANLPPISEPSVSLSKRRAQGLDRRWRSSLDICNLQFGVARTPLWFEQDNGGG
jgi:hypothetical protein